MFGCHTTPIKHNELDHFREFVETMPRGKPRDVVSADEKEKLGRWVAKAQQFGGIHRIGRRGPLEFQIIGLKSRFALNGSAQHFPANIRRRRLKVGLVGRPRGGNKDQLIKPKRFDCLAPKDQMPVMDRIEGSAENANSFHIILSEAQRSRRTLNCRPRATVIPLTALGMTFARKPIECCFAVRREK
jgi:hypothetical protein